MINPGEWMSVLQGRLLLAFGERLLYLGLQGSYRRGEATEGSDIDVVCVIDRFGLADLDAYRAVVRGMPEGEKACGFLSGREEVFAWPKHELFSLKMDTEDYYGALGDFLPPISREDVVDAVRIGAAGLYHGLVHTYLYAPSDEAREEFLRAAFKGAFFVLNVSYYLRTGEFCRTRRELAEALSGAEKVIARGGAGLSPAEGYGVLLEWVRNQTGL